MVVLPDPLMGAAIINAAFMPQRYILFALFCTATANFSLFALHFSLYFVSLHPKHGNLVAVAAMM
jgi:hypothetical protein